MQNEIYSLSWHVYEFGQDQGRCFDWKLLPEIDWKSEICEKLFAIGMCLFEYCVLEGLASDK